MDRNGILFDGPAIDSDDARATPDSIGAVSYAARTSFQGGGGEKVHAGSKNPDRGNEAVYTGNDDAHRRLENLDRGSGNRQRGAGSVDDGNEEKEAGSELVGQGARNPRLRIVGVGIRLKSEHDGFANEEVRVALSEGGVEMHRIDIEETEICVKMCLSD